MTDFKLFVIRAKGRVRRWFRALGLPGMWVPLDPAKSRELNNLAALGYLALAVAVLALVLAFIRTH